MCDSHAKTSTIKIYVKSKKKADKSYWLVEPL